MTGETIITVVGNLPTPTMDEWAAAARAGQQRAADKGYTPEHDAARGIRHLLNWAIEYARRGEPVKSTGLILSALSLTEPAADEVESLAMIIEAAWGDPTWDGKTLRPLDRNLARAVLAAGFRRQGPVTDAEVEAAWSGYTSATRDPHLTAHENVKQYVRAALEAARSAR